MAADQNDNVILTSYDIINVTLKETVYDVGRRGLGGGREAVSGSGSGMKAQAK